MVFRPTREFFHSYGDVTIACEGLQMLTCAWDSWPLSREGSLACHTYFDTGHPFIMFSPRTPDTHTYCRAFGSGAVTTCFYDLGLSRLGFKHPTYRLRRSHPLGHRRGTTCPVHENVIILHASTVYL